MKLTNSAPSSDTASALQLLAIGKEPLVRPLFRSHTCIPVIHVVDVPCLQSSRVVNSAAGSHRINLGGSPPLFSLALIQHVAWDGHAP